MKINPTKRNHYLSLFGLCFLIFFALGSVDDEGSDSSETEKVERVIPEMSDEEYLTYFQKNWDAVTLVKQDGFPQYETYQRELEAITQDMLRVLERDPEFTFDSTSKLNTLRLKLIDSKKYKEALENWLKYGQPYSKYELKSACEYYLKQVANDPSSIDIDDWKIEGQSKDGWLVLVKYRGKNGFGALVVNVSRFDVRFNPLEKSFYVQSMTE